MRIVVWARACDTRPNERNASAEIASNRLCMPSPGLDRCRLASGDPSGHDAFCDVATRQIKVPKAGAEFTSRVQAPNRVAAGISDLLQSIVDRAALRVGHRRPNLTENERRLVNAHHATRRTSEVCI